MSARGVAAVSVAIRFAAASIIRCCAAVGGSAALRMRHTPCGCRSAHLVEVRSNSRLPPVSTMRRAKQCRYFARSLPPRKRHSRLTIVRRGCCQVATRRDSWRSHVHRTHTAQRVQSFKLQTANVRGQGAAPLAFSWGSKGAILSRERMAPFPASPARCRGTYCPRQRRRTYFSSAALILASSSSSSWRYATLPTRVLGISSLNSMSYGMAYFATFLRQ